MLRLNCTSCLLQCVTVWVTVMCTCVYVYSCRVGISVKEIHQLWDLCVLKNKSLWQLGYQHNIKLIWTKRQIWTVTDRNYYYTYLELSTSSAKAPNKNSWVVLKTDHSVNTRITKDNKLEKLIYIKTQNVIMCVLSIYTTIRSSEGSVTTKWFQRCSVHSLNNWFVIQSKNVIALPQDFTQASFWQGHELWFHL